MRRPAIILSGLLALLAAFCIFDTNAQGLRGVHPYVTASWLAAILAFVVAGVLMGQFFIHSRTIYLFLGAGFVMLGVMGVWESLVTPSTGATGGSAAVQAVAAWQIGWIALAAWAVCGFTMNRRVGARPQVIGTIVPVAAVLLFLCALSIDAMSSYPAAGRWLISGRSGIGVGVVGFAALAVVGTIYRRTYAYRGNALLVWLSYGFLAAAVAEGVLLMGGRHYGTAFGAAGLIKIAALAMPLVGVMAEFTRLQVRLDEHVSELTNLNQIQKVVSTVTTPSDLYQRIVDLVSFSFGAVAVCLMPFDPERSLLYVEAQAGLDDEVARRLLFRPSEGPAGDCYSRVETVSARDVGSDPVLAQKLDGVEGIGSAVFAPIVVRSDECLGVLAVFFPYSGPRGYRMAKDRLRLLDGMAAETAIAMDAVQLRARMRSFNKASDDYSRDLDLMWEIGQAIESNLEVHSLVDTLSEKLKRALDAQACSMLLFEPDAVGLRPMGNKKLLRYHSDPEHSDDCDVLSAMVAKKGEPLILNHAQNSRRCKYPELARDDGGEHHLLSVPMALRGFMGAINVFRQNAEPFGERERRLLMRLAPMVAVGIRNAEMYERERSNAESLARSFLPELEKDLPGLRIAGCYKAAYDDSLVGGDFYGVVQIGGGKYGIMIGDVAGKGVEAAVYTAMTRYMVQAYSSENPDPVDVVTKLNRALCRYTPVGKFVTLVYGVLDPAAKSFTYVNAGHESPFHFKGADSGIDDLPTTGPALGAMMIEAEFTAETIRFEPGDIMVFYTDGATDVRSEGTFLGTDGLRRFVAANIRKSPYDLPDAIMNSIRNYATGHFRDDIAILVLEGCTPGALF